MGTVWRGYDAVLDRERAVALIRTDVIASTEQAEEFAKRFKLEARVTGTDWGPIWSAVQEDVGERPVDSVGTTGQMSVIPQFKTEPQRCRQLCCPDTKCPPCRA
jgi:hypothetical protein